MRRRQPRGAKPGDRAKPKADHRHLRQIRRRVPVPAGAADAARQIGRALGLDGLDRAAAAGAFDHADDRQPEIMRHLFGHQGLGRDRRIGRSAAHGEVVADHDDRTTLDLAATEHAVRRREMREFAGRIIFADAGDGADFVKASGIDQLVDALANREPALVMLSLDLVSAAHLPRERFAPGEVLELRLPDHSRSPREFASTAAARRRLAPTSGHFRHFAPSHRSRWPVASTPVPLPAAGAPRRTSMPAGRW